MPSPLSNKKCIASSLVALAAMVLCLSSVTNAQDRMFVPSPSAPPPMKFVSRDERAQLSATRDSKARIKTSIEMAEVRLLRAEQFVVDQRYIGAISELGIYQAIVEDALRFLSGQKADSNRTRDLFKRLEIELREHTIRLEAMRRVTPTEFALHLRDIADFARKARTAALNSFFSDTVIREETRDKSRTLEKEDSSGGSPTTPSKKQP